LSAAVDTAVVLEPERLADEAAALALVDRVFGPGRFAKAAERLRENNRRLLQLSFVARQDGALVGSVRLWPVRIGERAALLLGPIAVDEAARSQGLGAALVERACQAAAAAGHEAVILVGDVGFFGALGFEALPPGRVRLPGPADGRRILARALRPGALDGLEGEAWPAPEAAVADLRG
jgi:predicted N-acetyltransferase YhbS